MERYYGYGVLNGIAISELQNVYVGIPQGIVSVGQPQPIIRELGDPKALAIHLRGAKLRPSNQQLLNQKGVQANLVALDADFKEDRQSSQRIVLRRPTRKHSPKRRSSHNSEKKRTRSASANFTSRSQSLRSDSDVTYSSRRDERRRRKETYGQRSLSPYSHRSRYRKRSRDTSYSPRSNNQSQQSRARSDSPSLRFKKSTPCHCLRRDEERRRRDTYELSSGSPFSYRSFSQKRSRRDTSCESRRNSRSQTNSDRQKLKRSRSYSNRPSRTQNLSLPLKPFDPAELYHVQYYPSIVLPAQQIGEYNETPEGSEGIENYLVNGTAVSGNNVASLPSVSTTAESLATISTEHQNENIQMENDRNDNLEENGNS